MSPIVVLGVGNLLRQDEGVGVHAVRALSGAQLEEWAQLVDGGTAVFEALSDWHEIGKLIVIDAVRAGKDPGSISRLSLREVADRTAPALSVHEHGLLDALGLLQQAGLRVGEVVIYGVEPAEAGWGTDLSAPVAASLPALAARLREEVGLAFAEEEPL
ncbi:MAG: hydrogenase maturation protease [Armatimonadota bacterium]|nr:MAG: hydrogenase maturation protease [Armatimonadota bacterium]